MSGRGSTWSNALTPVNLQPLRKEIQPPTIDARRWQAIGSAIRALRRNIPQRVRAGRAGRARRRGRAPQRHAGRHATPSAPSCCARAYRLDAATPATPASWRPWSRCGVLEGRWKATKARERRRRWHGAAAGGATDLLISVEFRGMSEWQDISRKLAATPGIEELEVAGLSARGARVTLRYAGGARAAWRTRLPARALTCATRAAIGSLSAALSRSTGLAVSRQGCVFAGAASIGIVQAAASATAVLRLESAIGSPLYINIPNFITLGRVMSVPVIFWLLVNGPARSRVLRLRLRRHQRCRRRLSGQALRLAHRARRLPRPAGRQAADRQHLHRARRARASCRCGW